MRTRSKARQFHRDEEGHYVPKAVRDWQARHAVSFNIGEDALHFPLLPTDNSERRHAWKRTGADVGSKRNGHA